MLIYLHILLIAKFIILDFYLADNYDSENILHALYNFFCKLRLHNIIFVIYVFIKFN